MFNVLTLEEKRMATWKIDPVHSEIKFKIKHLLVSTVTGQFKKFDATIEAASTDFHDGKISFEADIDSIDTRNEQRDAHLKSPDFFDAPNFPKLSFVSNSVTKKNDEEYEVKGDMTIRGVTKEISLIALLGGVTEGFGGVPTAGFEVHGKLNRKDFGLLWHGVTEAGSIVVSDEVKIDITAELTSSKN